MTFAPLLLWLTQAGQNTGDLQPKMEPEEVWSR